MAVEIRFAPQFARVVKRLQRKYPHILEDLSPLLDELNSGRTPGDRLEKLSPYVVYKTRVPNSDARRGKSGGYRVLYYLRAAEVIILVTIFSKSDQSDVAENALRHILDEVEDSPPFGES
ncbi:MAG: type II toxin-antitoxin system RelE/ParE family toxin [Anaerolineae bacterium]|nr:type II toxin-antitoxin system RelE/ParE family toxin [Anaerolineae bacterium]